MNELTKMNLIAIVQQLPKEDIEFVQTYITILEDKLQQKDNIIKEVKEYIYNKEINTLHFNSKDFLDTSIATELLDILDKGE